MSLAQFQKVLLECYTNSESLELLSKQPEKYFNKFELTEKEKRVIQRIPNKVLRTFSQQLVKKNQKVLKVILRNTHCVAITPRSEFNTPALFWRRNKNGAISISPHVFQLLSYIAKEGEVLNIQTIFNTYNKMTSNKPPFVDMLRLTKTIFTHHLSGRIVFLKS